MNYYYRYYTTKRFHLNGHTVQLNFDHRFASRIYRGTQGIQYY